jgi:site-specific DNA-adenine methylase
VAVRCFLALKQLYPDRKYWINDLYFELYKFWEYTQKDLQDVINQVNTWKKDFENGKELHKYLGANISSFDDLKKSKCLFCIQQNYIFRHNRSRRIFRASLSKTIYGKQYSTIGTSEKCC